MAEAIVHYGLHFLAPALIARLIDKKQWKRIYLVLIATMLVDADHLLATPIFQANRCSIGFHPLHSFPAIATYVIALPLCWKNIWIRTVLIGLLFHMATDFIDCLFTWQHCGSCFEDWVSKHAWVKGKLHSP